MTEQQFLDKKQARSLREHLKIPARLLARKLNVSSHAVNHTEQWERGRFLAAIGNALREHWTAHDLHGAVAYQPSVKTVCLTIERFLKHQNWQQTDIEEFCRCVGHGYDPTHKPSVSEQGTYAGGRRL